MLKWNCNIDNPPKSGSVIVKILHRYPDYYKGDFNYHYPMGMQLNNLTQEEQIRIYQWEISNGYEPVKFWWIYAKDFPFPNQPERLSEKTSKEDAIV